MSDLNHEVTPMFNKAIYDSLLEVGTGWPEHKPRVSPGDRAQQEVAWYLSQLDDTRTVNSVRPELLVMLKKYELSSEDPNFQQALDPIDHLSARAAVDKIVAAVSVLTQQPAAQQPTSTPIKRTNLRSLPQPITNPMR